MLKKLRPFLATPLLFLVILSCKPQPESTTTETASATDTSATAAATDTAATNATTTIAPPPSTHDIDHYKFWQVASVQFSRSVLLQGQFDKVPWKAAIGSIEYLGNPVSKNDERMLRPDWHLVGYRISEAAPQPGRSVTIENQFRKGEQLTLGGPAWLLLPASKDLTGQQLPDPPREADHYVCYRVAAADPVHGPVRLVDQFDQRRKKVEEIQQLSVAFFCVPVSKDGGKIFRPKEHLTIYRLDPTDQYAITAYTNDQFGKQKLSVKYSELLAVPTTKLDWKEK